MRLARAMGSRVALLRVLETDILPTTLDPDQQLKLDQLVAQAQERSLEYLQSLQARLHGDGVEATTDVLPGSPAEAIVFLAHSLGADLIAMCTHGRTGLERWRRGSVAEKVLQTADCALLLVRAGEGVSGEIRRVLLPLDGSEIAERAAPMAQMLAGALAVPLVLVRAVPTAGMVLAGWDVDGIVSGELLVSIEEEAASYIEQQAAALRHGGLTVDAQVVRGDPAIELGKLASAETLVVMATHGRTGPGRYVMGSVAEKLARGASGPVLVVR
jgi:nucleotide-binding universal stress UspA family protein